MGRPKPTSGGSPGSGSRHVTPLDDNTESTLPGSVEDQLLKDIETSTGNTECDQLPRENPRESVDHFPLRRAGSRDAFQDPAPPAVQHPAAATRPTTPASPFPWESRRASLERRSSLRLTLTVPDESQRPPTRSRAHSLTVPGEASVSSRFGNMSQDGHPMTSWFASEVREELQSINRKLDELAAQLKLKSPCRRSTSESSQSFHNSRKSSTVSQVENPIDTAVLKTLQRQKSMHSGLELVLTNQPLGLLGSQPKTLPRADTTSSFASRMNWGLTKSRSGIFQSSSCEALGTATSSGERTAEDGGAHSVNWGFQRIQRRWSQPTMVEEIPDPPSFHDGDSADGKYDDLQTEEEEESTGSPKTPKRKSRLDDDNIQKDIAKANAKLFLNSTWSRRRAIWNFLEIPETNPVANFFASVMHVFIICSTLVTLIQAIDVPHFGGTTAATVETLIDAVFLVELITRFVCCPSREAFFLSVYNWIDVAAAAPLFVRMAIGWEIPEGQVESLPHGILLCAVPIIRLLKTLRRFEKFHLLLRAFSLSAEALPVLLFILIVIALFFAVLIYFAESRENITSLSHAFWLSIVTMTTVGYGDVAPKSGPGCVIVGVLVIVTMLYMALPLGIIGCAFTDTWQDRDRILLMQRTRDRLCQWGYSARDIPVLFRVTDKNGDGELDIKEFRKLLTQMQVGFSEERILKLFQSFDVDGNGTVDDEEFVKALFPEAYHEIYCAEERDSVGVEDLPSEEGGKLSGSQGSAEAG